MTAAAILATAAAAIWLPSVIDRARRNRARRLVVRARLEASLAPAYVLKKRWSA